MPKTLNSNPKLKQNGTNGSTKSGLSLNQQKELLQTVRDLTTNLVMSRAALTQFFNGMGANGKYDLYGECGYPQHISAEDYKKMFDRSDIANRVVRILPTECWTVEPLVYETEKMAQEDQTEFENAWKTLYEDHALYEKLHRLDEISGIGHYGVLFMGIDDGRDPSLPVVGIKDDGTSDRQNNYKLLYTRVLDETQAKIKEFEKNRSSVRFGYPVSYECQLETDIDGNPTGRTQNVHWTRIIHVADNCTTSEIFGVPRMRSVFNRLLDVQKLLGSSAEMFWKGGFPGYAFEVPPELAAQVELDKDELQEEVEKYLNTTKRYLALQGVQARNLSTQIADPDTHLEVQILAICIALEVPRKIFMGSEEAKLASVQDDAHWMKKVQRRQAMQCTGHIIRPFANRCQAMGILPTVEKFYVAWPDIYSISEADQAEITAKLVRAVAEYVTSGSSTLITPLHFLTMIMHLTPEEAKEVLDASEQEIDRLEKAGIVDISGRPVDPTIEEQQSKGATNDEDE